MKKFIPVFFSIIMTSTAVGQKIKVSQSTEKIGGGSHNALSVTLFGISPSDAEDAFRSYMKAYNGKRTSKDGDIFIDHALIKEMGNNTIDIYGKAVGKKGDPEIKFLVAFDLGGSFLNSGDHKDQYTIAEKITKEFAIKATKDVIEKQLKEAQKKQSDFEDEQRSLEKNNKNLNSDIEEYKRKIKKAEEELVQNKSDQELKKSDLAAQKKVVGDIEKKLKSVE